MVGVIFPTGFSFLLLSMFPCLLFVFVFGFMHIDSNLSNQEPFLAFLLSLEFTSYGFIKLCIILLYCIIL